MTNAKSDDPISIHAPRRGSDSSFWTIHRSKVDFNPRSPQGERRKPRLATTARTLFQSTLPAGGATMKFLFSLIFPIISIHAPRRGSDAAAFGRPTTTSGFQSTLPAGGATSSVSWGHLSISISIHAPRRGSDLS